MKKLVVLIVIVLGMTLLVPAAASARTPTLASLAKTVAALQAKVNRQQTTITSLKKKLANAGPVLRLAPYVTVTQTTLDGVSGPNIVFKGVNVHVQSSLGETDTSGLGNLIVGWNENPSGTPPNRGGSNNLVCGDMNGFSGCGGFVAGEQNSVGVGFNSILGGFGNTANAWWFSTVSGGTNNTASGANSTVSGGHDITENYTNGWAAGPYESH